MVDRVTFTTPESGATPPPAPVVDPNLPEENPPDLAKSYAELRAKFTQTSQELSALKKGDAPAAGDPPAPAVTPPAPADAPKAGDPPVDPNAPKDPAAAAQEVADKAGFDLTSYNDEYIATGDVTPENRAKIVDGLKGVLGENTEALVNQFIEGQKAVHANQRTDFYNAAGGEESYNEMLVFARETMTDAERNAFNTAINGQDHAGRMLALEGLKSKYEAQNGRIPSRITPGSQGFKGGVAAFDNSAQMVQAMSDPKYQTDPAYRDLVAKRIAASPNL